MRVLVDITHPVNVHFFKHLIWLLQTEGHDVLVTARDKDVTVELLNAVGIAHQVISRRGSGLLGMAKELVERDLRLLRVARRFRPDIMVAAEAGVSIGPVGAALGVPRVVFEQVDHAPLQRVLGLPFATHICTGTGYLKGHGARQVRFRGFLAQAYLDPRRYRPDPAPLRRAGLDPDQTYIVLRLVRWSATHDVGRAGLDRQGLERAIARLGRYGRVVVSSEGPLPEPLEEHRNPVPAIHFHDLLAFAGMCVAEGGTVAVEAGIQGTPSICCNSYDFGYLRALEEQYGVIRRTGSLPEALDVAEKLVRSASSRRSWQQRRLRMFQDSEDVLAFMRRVVEEVAVNGRAGRRNKRARLWTPKTQIPSRPPAGRYEPVSDRRPVHASRS